ncbi:MAG: SufE family protein [Clostridia bacterium]|nr:SufE family protein [Clostridia bacterium]
MMKKSIKEIQDELIIEFSEFDDWVDKYTLIMSYSAELEKMLYEYKTDDILFKDCASKVWILIECKDNKVCFFADSDSMIIRGILAILQKILNDQDATEVVDGDIFFMKEIGMELNMPIERSKGIKSIIAYIKNEAREQCF